MNERIKYLRESILKKNQDEFSKDLGLSRNYISLIENGQRNLSDQSIKVLCSLYGVNEEWLRFGTGEPFVPQSQKEKLLGFVKDVMKDTDGSFRKNFVDALADLEPEDWVAIEKFTKKLLKKTSMLR